MKFKILAIFALFFIIFGFVQAVETTTSTKLIVPIPGGPGTLPANTEPVEYIKTAYLWGVGFGALLALLMIVIGSIQYISSAGYPSAQGDAKARILYAVMGLVLLLGATAILNTLDTGIIDNSNINEGIKEANQQLEEQRQGLRSSPEYQQTYNQMLSDFDRLGQTIYNPSGPWASAGNDVKAELYARLLRHHAGTIAANGDAQSQAWRDIRQLLRTAPNRAPIAEFNSRLTEVFRNGRSQALHVNANGRGLQISRDNAGFYYLRDNGFGHLVIRGFDVGNFWR